MNPRFVLKQTLGNAVWGRHKLIKFEDAVSMTREWCSRLPRSYDLVIGIPRTGLTIAGIISDYFAIPLSTPDLLPSFWAARDTPKKEIRSILIVEDGTTFGSRLFPAKAKAYDFFPGSTVHIGSLLVNKETIPLDTYGFMLCDRTVAEWQLLHIEFSQNVASDLDGVLCQDPPKFNDETDYIDWMARAIPYRKPIYCLSAIITSRPEKYKGITEDWLKENDIRYQRLIMSIDGVSTMVQKAAAINKYQPDFFLESNDGTAKELHLRTGVPVICISTMRLYS